VCPERHRPLKGAHRRDSGNSEFGKPCLQPLPPGASLLEGDRFDELLRARDRAREFLDILHRVDPDRSMARSRLEARARFGDDRPFRPPLRFEDARHAPGRGFERGLRAGELQRRDFSDQRFPSREPARGVIERGPERFRERYGTHHPSLLDVERVRREASLLVIERHVVRLRASPRARCW